MATTTLARLAIKVVANTKAAVKGLGRFGKSVQGIRSRIDRFGKAIFSVRGAVTALAGAAGFGLLAKRAFELGAAVAETESKFLTVFGNSSDAAQAFIDDFATMAGLSEQAARDIVATTGSIAQGMGFAQSQSAAFAEEIVRVAGDLSSFNNIPIAETSLAVQAALTGEREQMKRLGIVIREADVQQRALAMSSKTVAAELTQQEKATATLALVKERAGVAIGDLARTQDSAANQARALGAEIQNVKERIATALLPAFEVIIPKVRAFVGQIGEMTDKLTTSGVSVKAWAQVAVSAFNAVWDTVKLVGATIKEFGEGLGGLAAAIVTLFENPREAVNILKDTWNDFQVTVSTATVTAVDSILDYGVAVNEAMAETRRELNSTAEAVRNVATAASSGAGGGGSAAMALTVPFRELAADAAMAKIRIGEIPDAIEPTASAMSEIVAQGRTFRDTFVDAAVQSGLSFSRLANRVIADLGRMALQASALGIFNLLTGGAGGFLGGFKSVFGGFFDSGGRIRAGQFGIVGERGPELVRGPANVTGREETASMMSGGSTAINVTLVAADTGKAVDQIRYQIDRDEARGKEVRIPMRAAVMTG